MVSAIVGLNIGKWVPNIGAMARVAILALFVVSVLVYAVQHGVHGFGGGDFVPTYALFIAVVPVLIFNFVGFETPNAAGEELKNPQKDVPFAVARAGLLTILLYGLPILGVLLVLPTSQVTSLGGFLNAMKTVFTIYGGSVDPASGAATLTGAGLVLGTVVALGFVWALATSGTTWIMSADRAQAVAGYDGAAPRFMGRISARFGTPVTVNTLTGIVATLVMILAFAITGGDAKKYFSAVLGLAISTTTITYLPMFAGAIVLRYNRYKSLNRPYRVPFGNLGMWVCSILTVGFCVLATISVIWPGFGTSDPEAALSGLGWAGQRATFEIVQIAPLVVMALIGVVFYFLGAPTRKQMVSAPAPMRAAMTAPAGD